MRMGNRRTGRMSGVGSVMNVWAVSLVEPMNKLYRQEWSVYPNFFLLIMKLVEKGRLGARYRKK